MKLIESLKQLRGGVQAELDSTRDQITERQEELRWLESSPPPIEELAKAQSDRVLAWADHHLERNGSPSVDANPLLDTHGEVNLDTVTALLAPTLAELIRERIEALSYEAGPPMAARPKAIQKARDELQKLERREEELISAAAGEGLMLTRRTDASVEAILRVEYVKGLQHV